MDYSHGVNQTPLLGTGGLIFMGLYLLSLLLLVGWVARHKKKIPLLTFILRGGAWGYLFSFSPFMQRNTAATHWLGLRDGHTVMAMTRWY